jgi:hypothetical protein
MRVVVVVWLWVVGVKIRWFQQPRESSKTPSTRAASRNNLRTGDPVVDCTTERQIYGFESQQCIRQSSPRKPTTHHNHESTSRMRMSSSPPPEHPFSLYYWKGIAGRGDTIRLLFIEAEQPYHVPVDLSKLYSLTLPPSHAHTHTLSLRSLNTTLSRTFTHLHSLMHFDLFPTSAHIASLTCSLSLSLSLPPHFYDRMSRSHSLRSNC